MREREGGMKGVRVLDGGRKRRERRERRKGIRSRRARRRRRRRRRGKGGGCKKELMLVKVRSYGPFLGERAQSHIYYFSPLLLYN